MRQTHIAHKNTVQLLVSDIPLRASSPAFGVFNSGNRLKQKYSVLEQFWDKFKTGLGQF